MNSENERIDDLQLKGMKLIQNKSLFCFGMDAVLLADYAKIKKGSTVIDLGTGNGILPVLLHGKYKASHIVGVELVNKNVLLAKKNMHMNRIENKVTILHEDVKNLPDIFTKGSFDFVITNPPYKKANSGIISKDNEMAIAKHEVSATLEDFIFSSSHLLKDLGVFYMVNRPERLVDTLVLMRKYKIEPKRIKFVLPGENKKPTLFLISGTKFGNAFLTVEENLVIRKKSGEYTEALLKIYEEKEE